MKKNILSWVFFKQIFPEVFASLIFITLSSFALFTEISLIRAEKDHYLYYPDQLGGFSELQFFESEVDPEYSTGNFFVGGGSTAILPLDIKFYTAKKGDTLSGIAERFGLDLDTIASLNREWGSGVHLVSIGEEIKIPNQDGIFLSLQGGIDQFCAQKGVLAEAVLLVNRKSREEIKPGMELFLPGVQHTGVERSVAIGAAFLKPVRGWISSGFGYRRDPFSGEINFHRGLDIAAYIGAPVRASMDGRVVLVGDNSVFGKYILIAHQIGYSSFYGHLNRVLVSRGEVVRRGQKIGSIGNTGRSTGPHLHFEVRRNGIALDCSGLISGIY